MDTTRKRNRRRPGPPKKYGRRYPWDKWFGQEKFRLVLGKHYHHRTHSMAQMVRNVACARKIQVTITIAPDYQSITVTRR